MDLKPCKIRNLSSGPKHSNSVLTRLRVGRSDLNLHTFSIGHIDKPECICYAEHKSTMHYVLVCILYAAEHQNLFGIVEHHIPHFKRINTTEQLVIKLRNAEIANYHQILCPADNFRDVFFTKDFISASCLFASAPIPCLKKELRAGKSL